MMMPSFATTLGAEATADKSLLSILPWLALLFVLILIGGVAILIVRNKLRTSNESAPEDTGFTLADLRKLRDRGELTAEEYETARVKMIAKVKGNLGKPAPELPEDPKNAPPTDPEGPTP